jgi:hypothetical protein
MKKLIFIMLAILMLSACKTTTKIVEVPVEVVKKEYIHDTKLDSVYIRDSIDRWQKGDTLLITKYYTKYKYLSRIDTILKVDTIPKIVSTTIEKKVEVNHIYWYQKLLMWLGGITMIILIIVITYSMKNK